MNGIRRSMEGITASRELKEGTLRYLERQRARRGCTAWRRVSVYGLAAACCLFLLLGVGWRFLYAIPTSYISMDVNPSIELGVNRYGRVVAAEAYNQDGQDILEHFSLKNKPYVQAVSILLEDETYRGYLTENATLVFTVISDSPEAIMEALGSIGMSESYSVLTYTSDSHCMEEAHRYQMSFGKYRAYLELAAYDGSVTLEDCHGMSMGEIQERIVGCRQHEGESQGGHHYREGYPGQEEDGTGWEDGADRSGGTRWEDDADQGGGTQWEDGVDRSGGARWEDNADQSGGTRWEDGADQSGGTRWEDGADQSSGTDWDSGDCGGRGYGGHHGGHHDR